MDDGLNAWRWQELLWTLRWLAADADAALAVVPDVCVPDEIALDMDHWTQVARDWDLVSGPVLALLQEIDQEFRGHVNSEPP